MIRAARSDEISLLQTLKQAAGAPFREAAIHAIADDAPPSLEGLAAFVQAGQRDRRSPPCGHRQPSLRISTR
jgi:hypothetical protein